MLRYSHGEREGVTAGTRRVALERLGLVSALNICNHELFYALELSTYWLLQQSCVLVFAPAQQLHHVYKHMQQKLLDLTSVY